MTGRKKVVSARMVKARVQVMLRGTEQDVELNTERNRLITMIEGMQASNTLGEFVMDSLREKLRRDEGQTYIGYGAQVPPGAVLTPQPFQPQPGHVANGGQQRATQVPMGTAVVHSEPAPSRPESQEPKSSTMELSDGGELEQVQPANRRPEDQAVPVQVKPAFTPPKPRRPMGGNALSAMGH